MLLKDLDLDGDIKAILARVNFDNKSEAAQKVLIKYAIFSIANNQDYIDGKTDVCKSNRENLNDWWQFKKHDNYKKLNSLVNTLFTKPPIPQTTFPM